MDKGRCSSRAQYLLIKGIAATSGIVSRLQDTAHRTPYYVLNPQALSPKPHKIYSRKPEAQTFKAWTPEVKSSGAHVGEQVITVT